MPKLPCNNKALLALYRAHDLEHALSALSHAITAAGTQGNVLSTLEHGQCHQASLPGEAPSTLDAPQTTAGPRHHQTATHQPQLICSRQPALFSTSPASHKGQHTKWAPHHPVLHATRGAKSKVEVEYYPMLEPTRDKYTTEPTNYLQLLGAISNAANLDRLKHLVQTYGGAFHAAHLAAALARLPKLAKYHDRDLTEGVMLAPSSETPSVEEVRPVRMPRRGAQPRPGFRAGAEPVAMQLMAMLVGQANVQFVEPVSPHVKGKALKQISLWRLKGAGTVRGKQGVGRAAADLTPGEPLAEHFSPRDTSTTVWALGTLASMGVKLHPALVQRCVSESLTALSQSQYAKLWSKGTVVDVALLLKGLALLRGSGNRHREALQTLASWTVQHIDQFQARDVQMALRSFVTLGYHDPQLLDTLAERAVVTARDFTPDSIASTLHALAAAFPSHKASHVAMEALAAGVAPQIVLLSPDALATLATALAQLGGAYVDGAAAPSRQQSGVATAGVLQAAGSGVGNPAGLPKWLHGLVCFLGDKAVRDVGQLQPLQVAAVLGMMTQLRVPHGQLLRAVVDGVLGEDQLDTALPGQAAASFVRAVHTLTPLLGDQESTLNTALMPKPRAPPVSAREQAVITARQTGMGLGNLPPVDTPVAAGLAMGPRDTVGLAVSEVVPPDAPSTGPDALSVAGQVPRQSYQALLTSGTPFQRRAEAAVWRVLSVYMSPKVLQACGLSDMVALTELCVDVRLQGMQPLVDAVLEEAVYTVQDLKTPVSTDDSPSKAAHLSNPATLDNLARVLAASVKLQHKSAQLSGAAADYLQHAVQHSTNTAALLPAAVKVLAACRLHDTEPAAAADAVARAYTTVVTTPSTTGSQWPSHTASGLAPTPQAGSSAGRPVLSGAQLGQLLQACAASGSISEPLVKAAVMDVSLLMSAPSRQAAEEQLAWMLACAQPLLSHAKTMQQQGKPLSAEQTGVMGLLLRRAKDVAREAVLSTEQREQLTAVERAVGGVDGTSSY